MRRRYSRKKILFMLTSMNIGGVEKSLISLLEILPKNEYDITVLLLDKKGGFLKYIPNWVKVKEAEWYPKLKPVIMQPPQDTIKSYLNNKEIFKIPPFTLSYIASKRFNDRYIYYKEVMREIPMYKEYYDVAIAYQGPTDIIDYYIANKVNASKKISWIHFDVSKHEINEKLYKKLYKKMDKLFVVSDEAINRLVEKIPTCENKIERHLNVIDSDLIRKMSLSSTDFDDDFEGVKIVTVGRLSLEKGQDLAIKALSRLIDEGYNVRWYCIGEGNDRNYLEELIRNYKLENNFFLVGNKLNPYPYILKSDIYVQPSRHEGFCLTLAEAKCLGKPIVTTGFSSAYEQIRSGHDGWIVGDNEKELFEKISLLIENPCQRESLSENLYTNTINKSGDTEKFIRFIGEEGR
ncbi:glycosyltransferase [Halobacillus trueperi]|uniref:glycosyltransferase n=1 Tax=Halobacillus trueperi TaxID=156205 RepID=UPI003735E283